MGDVLRWGAHLQPRDQLHEEVQGGRGLRAGFPAGCVRRHLRRGVLQVSQIYLFWNNVTRRVSV